MANSFSIRAAAKILVPETGQEISCLKDFLSFQPNMLSSPGVVVTLSFRARATEVCLPGFHIELVLVDVQNWEPAHFPRLACAVLVARHFLRAAGLAIHRHLYRPDAGLVANPPSGTFTAGADTEQALKTSVNSYLLAMKFANQSPTASANYVPVYYIVGPPPMVGTDTRLGQVGTLCEACAGNAYSGLLGALIWNVPFVSGPTGFQYPYSFKLFPQPSPMAWSSTTMPPAELFRLPAATFSPLPEEWTGAGSLLLHELLHVLGLVHSTEAADGANCSACGSDKCPEFDDVGKQSEQAAAQQVVSNIMFPTVGQGFQLVASQVALIKKHCAVHPPLMKLPW